MIPNLKIAFNIWTYDGDQEKTIICVEAIKKSQTGLCYRIFIWNDGLHSISRESREILSRLGCEVKDTFFERSGRLIGRECHLGMMGNYLECSRHFECGYVAKIDPDTLFVGNLSPYLNVNYLAQTSGGGIRGMYGFYCFRAAFLSEIFACFSDPLYEQKILEYAKSICIKANLFFKTEDFTFALMAIRFFRKGLTFLPRGGFWKSGLGFNVSKFLKRKKETVLYDFGTPNGLKIGHARVLQNMGDCLANS